jgi:hypothetical protein
MTGVNKNETDVEAKKRSRLFDSKPIYEGLCCLVHDDNGKNRFLRPERSCDIKLISESRLCDLIGMKTLDDEMFPYKESSMCSVCEKSFANTVSRSQNILKEGQDIQNQFKYSKYQNDGTPHVWVSRRFMSSMKTYLTKLAKYHEKLVTKDSSIERLTYPRAPDGAVNENIQCKHGRIKATITKRSIVCVSKSLFDRLETFLKQNANKHVSSVRDISFVIFCLYSLTIHKYRYQSS